LPGMRARRMTPDADVEMRITVAFEEAAAA
jgi:hypothetical protein